jgi:hypothetical protein
MGREAVILIQIDVTYCGVLNRVITYLQQFLVINDSVQNVGERQGREL